MTPLSKFLMSLIAPDAKARGMGLVWARVWLQQKAIQIRALCARQENALEPCTVPTLGYCWARKRDHKRTKDGQAVVLPKCSLMPPRLLAS